MEDLSFGRLLSAEWLKCRRTPVKWLAFAVPVAVAALLTGYFSLKTAAPGLQISAFMGFFETWGALVIPMSCGLLSGFLVHQEESSGSFNGFLGTKIPRSRLYLGKFAMLAALTASGTLLATLGLGAGLGLLLHVQVAWPIFVLAALMTVAAALPLLAFHLWISLAWGMGASVGFGGGGILIAALSATSLGDRIWPYVMWALPVRLSRLPGMYLLYTTDRRTPPEAIAAGVPLHETMKGLLSVAILLLVLLIGGMLWFKKWEGRKSDD